MVAGKETVVDGPFATTSDKPNVVPGQQQENNNF
jgi:hypothetical protein